MIRTERLLLRQWRGDDFAPFRIQMADARVTEHFPQALTAPEADDLGWSILQAIHERGWGLWAVEVPGITAFAGFVGLSVPAFPIDGRARVEVGWSLAAEHWGKGYATEGGRAALDYGFTVLGLSEIVAFTVPANRRSRAVMERLGMRRDDGKDFDHPRIAEGHPLRRHVLYRVAS